MYVPDHFLETNPEVLHRFIREHPLGTLITTGVSGLNADHLPFVLDLQNPPPILRGHVARANPLWSDADLEMESLIIFQGPSAYISPSWYASKAEHGKVVPTYNYVTVHAYGKVKAVHDAAWLRPHLTALTNQFESKRSEPWQIADAPAEFTEKLMASIVGLEIQITRLIGKWKVSQNRAAPDKQGVERGLIETGDPQSVAMARLIKQHAS